MRSRLRLLNGIMASSRLRNSGLNVCSTAPALRSDALLVEQKPTGACSISRAPALVVMMSTTLRKSALRPVLSVSVA